MQAISSPLESELLLKHSNTLLFLSSPGIRNNATFYLLNIEDCIGNLNVHFVYLKHLEGNILQEDQNLRLYRLCQLE